MKIGGTRPPHSRVLRSTRSLFIRWQIPDSPGGCAPPQKTRGRSNPLERPLNLPTDYRERKERRGNARGVQPSFISLENFWSPVGIKPDPWSQSAHGHQTPPGKRPPPPPATTAAGLSSDPLRGDAPVRRHDAPREAAIPTRVKSTSRWSQRYRQREQTIPR